MGRRSACWGLLVFLFTIYTLSCAGGSSINKSQAPPVVPDITGTASELSESAGHNLWGYYLVVINQSDYSTEIIPIRATAAHWNVLRFLEQGPCSNCFKLEGVTSNPDGTLNVNVSITHPFTNMNLTGFDVRGIAIFNGSHEFPESGLVVSDRALGETEVLNADGYTALYNPTTAGHSFEGYIKGKLATQAVLSSTLNAFKRFITDTPANVRNAFYTGSKIAVTFIIDPPEPPNSLVFGYAIDASWAPPIDQPVDDPMTDFGPDANCPEGWKIVVTEAPVGDGLTDCGGQARLTIDVYDWQGKEDAHPVIVECPELFAGEIEVAWKADGAGLTTYEAVVENANSAPAGLYRCLVSKEAQENDPVSKPWLDITAYQLHEVEVVVATLQVPTAVAEASQLSAYVDEIISFDASGSHDNDCGNQSIIKCEWDWDNDGTYDEEGVMADHSWSTEGTHYVQLRVTDDENQTDTLDVPLEIEISPPADYPLDVTPPWLNYSPNDACIDGNYLYIASDSDGLLIYDVTDLVNPAWVNIVDTPGTARAVIVSGGYAWIADGQSGLQIMDIDPPEFAHIVKSVDTPGDARGVAVLGGYAFIADSLSGLQMIDIDPIESAYIVKSVDTPGSASGVAILNGYAYVADQQWGLQVIDVNPPESASIVKTVDTPAYSRDVKVSGSYAYVADWGSGLQIVDISTPESAYIVKSVPITPGAAEGVAISGGYAYVAAWGLGLQVVDIEPVNSAYAVATVSIPDVAWRVAASGGYAYVVDPSRGIQIVDVEPPGAAYIANSIETPGYAWGIAISGNYAYVADWVTGLPIVNISVPESAYIVHSVKMPDNGWGIATSGGYAYVADYNAGLQIVNANPPEFANIVNIIDGDDLEVGVAVSGDYAYVADWAAGLQIVDINPPESAYIAGSVSTSSAQAVAVSGDYAYVADMGSGLRIVNINPPGSAYVVQTVDTPGDAWGVCVSGGYAYVADNTAGLTIINIQSPGSAYAVKTVDTPGSAVQVAVSGGYAYVADSSGGLQIIDISPPESAYLADSAITPGQAVGIAVSANYAYVAAINGGLRIFKLW
jgi:hypothetical protein